MTFFGFAPTMRLRHASFSKPPPLGEVSRLAVTEGVRLILPAKCKSNRCIRGGGKYRKENLQNINEVDFFGRNFMITSHFRSAKSNSRTPSVCLRQPPPSMREARGKPGLTREDDACILLFHGEKSIHSSASSGEEAPKGSVIRNPMQRKRRRRKAAFFPKAGR